MALETQAPGQTGLGTTPFVVQLAIRDKDRASYVTMPTFNADNVAVIRMRVSAGTVRDHTIPDVASDTFALIAATQTLTNKTLTSAVVATDFGVPDDVSIELGDGDDSVLRHKSGTLTANTALTDVLIGTPVTGALAANSTIISNVTASGDILVAYNSGGNSIQALRVDASAGIMELLGNGGYAFLGLPGADGARTNANMTTGITINQEGADNEILALKSSDVAHGLVSTTETDTYMFIQKASAGVGGVLIHAIRTNDAGANTLLFRASGATANATKTTAGAYGLAQLEVQEHDGSDASANITANGNVWAVRAYVGGAQATRWAVDEDGEGHLANTTLVLLSDDVPDALMQRGGRILAGAPSPYLEEMWGGIQAETGLTKAQMARWFEERKIMNFEWSGGKPFVGEPLPYGGMTSVRNGIYFAWDGLWQAHEDRKALRADLGGLVSKVEALRAENAELRGMVSALGSGS